MQGDENSESHELSALNISKRGDSIAHLELLKAFSQGDDDPLESSEKITPGVEFQPMESPKVTDLLI